MRLHVGEPQRVQVRAGEKVIDDVGLEVRDGTLHVTFDHNGFGGGDVVVEASVPKLTGIDASGSGDIDADGIDADAFDVRSDGSADIALAGTAGRLAVDSNGSGDADLAGLTAREARVAVNGSGDVDVRADDAARRRRRRLGRRALPRRPGADAARRRVRRPHPRGLGPPTQESPASATGSLT